MQSTRPGSSTLRAFKTANACIPINLPICILHIHRLSVLSRRAGLCHPPAPQHPCRTPEGLLGIWAFPAASASGTGGQGRRRAHRDGTSVASRRAHEARRGALPQPLARPAHRHTQVFLSTTQPGHFKAPSATARGPSLSEPTVNGTHPPLTAAARAHAPARGTLNGRCFAPPPPQ